MARALLALRAALLRPAPTWAWWAVAACVIGCFVLACWAFAFPLSYCDSPSWAPDYLARLVDTREIIVKQRGVVVPAWFRLWGTLSIAAGFGNLIGVVQAVALGSAALAVLLRLRRDARSVELLVLPALALSGLRHAIYSQTLLSESVVIPLVVAVAFWTMRRDPVS